MSEKVKLTKAQAEKIENLLDYHTKEKIVEDFVTAESRSKEGFALDVLIKALYIGYEVERKPEDYLLLDYEHCHEELINAKTNDTSAYWAGRKEGIVTTLAILNIKIKGIND